MNHIYVVQEGKFLVVIIKLSSTDGKHLQNELSRRSFTYREEAGENDLVQKCRKFISHQKDDATNETQGRVKINGRGSA